jgi:L-lactate dehydrogenase complex protein LldF
MPQMADYARQEHQDFHGAAASALADSALQTALTRLTDTLMAGNRRAFASLADSDRLRDRAKQIKKHALDHLDQYLIELENSVLRVGGSVHWAITAEDAQAAVVAIAKAAGCRKAVKSKSMTSEEIHLNAALESAGIEITETDFGEFILQVTGERPSHLVAPAVHHTRESISRALSQFIGEKVPDDPQVLAQVGKRILRKRFQDADLGITGVNFAVAETGTIVLVTNEGNGRLTTACPRVHVAIMGIEKVIPKMADLPVFLKLLARAATGQPLSVYTTLITGPRRPGEADGPDEFHLIILDNGRSRVLGSPFRESLQCIRCGACLNACPVYRRIGGHAYGGVYSGPIGSVLTPLFDQHRKPQVLPQASSLCGACLAACPVRIDIPRMLIGLRDLGHQIERNRWEGAFFRIWMRAVTWPLIYQLSCTLLLFSRFWSRAGWLRHLPRPAHGWTLVRDFPAPARESFRKSLRKYGS